MTRFRLLILSRRQWCFGFFALALMTVVLILKDFKGDVDNLVKIDLIEKAITSKGNRQSCRIPELPVSSPEIDKFLRRELPVVCQGEDWIRCQDSQCRVVAKAVNYPILCDVVELLWKTDYGTEEGETRRIILRGGNESFQLEKSDFARVSCRTSTRPFNSWKGIVYGVRRTEFVKQFSLDPLYNVLMFGFDSLSRNAFIRKLPKSYKYLVEEIGAHVLEGYNIVGDGTPQALIPILTGRTELELPETRKRKSNSVPVDVYPLIWKAYKEAGYRTAFNEDLPRVGTFTYRLNGFTEQPTDHYMRPYFLAIDPKLGDYERLCVGDQPRHLAFMDYTYQILAQAPRGPKKFIFSFHGELSHDSINLIEVADEDLLTFLKKLKTNFLDNTILILMSDHGNRFADVRNTYQGKLEERLPFFSFALPASFKQRFPEAYKNLVVNSHGRLITPFDINLTLRHILELQLRRTDQADELDPPLPPNLKKPHRALSLLTPISPKRSCADAYIEPHWCSCLQWTELKTYDSMSIKASKALLSHINMLTTMNRKLCSRLQIKEVLWAGQMSPSDDLLRFQASSDRDGYLGSFAEDSKLHLQIVQIKLVTVPGEAIYEASIQYNATTSQYRVDTEHISRVNKYGEQANCIYQLDPELRKFCYCNK